MSGFSVRVRSGPLCYFGWPAPWPPVRGASWCIVFSQGFPVVARCAAGCCARVVGGWSFGVALRLGPGVRGRLGVDGRGWCRVWVGSAAAGLWLLCFFMSIILPSQRLPSPYFFLFFFFVVCFKC